MNRISHFKLGLFVLACAAVGAVALIWIGATGMFQSTRTYAAFFGEPVTGIDSGAAVEHLGVRIGSVDSVDLAPDDRLVRVVVKLQSSFRVDPAWALSVSQAGLTGSPFLALDEAPPAERRDLPHPATKHPVLPTRSGGGGLGGIEKKISSLDVQGLVAAWEGVARDLDAVLKRGGIEQVIDDARATSAGVRRVAGAGPRGEPSQLEVMVRDLRASTQALRSATASVARQVDAIRPGVIADIANRADQAADRGQGAVQRIAEGADASLALVRQDLAQLRQAVVEAESLARSLRTEPNRVIERGGGGSEPFKR